MRSAKAPVDQRRRDDGEHQLIDHEGLQRNGRGIVGIRRRAHAVQEQVLKISDEAIAGTKSQAEPDNAPNDGHDGHHGKALHHGGQYIFPAHQAAVKQRQPGPGHQQNQRRTDQHPRVIGVAAGRGYLVLEVRNLLRSNGLSAGYQTTE